MTSRGSSLSERELHAARLGKPRVRSAVHGSQLSTHALRNALEHAFDLGRRNLEYRRDFVHREFLGVSKHEHKTLTAGEFTNQL